MAIGLAEITFTRGMPGESQRRYQQAAELIAKNTYAPFGLAFAPANLSVKGVHGPGLTTKIPAALVNSQVVWNEVWMEK